MNRITKLAMLGALATAMSLMPVSAGAQTCVTAPSGIVSCWPADGNAKDIVDGNDGTPQNGATFSTGLAGQAFSFDGVDDFVDIGDKPSLEGFGQLTVAAWIRMDSLPTQPYTPVGKEFAYRLVVDPTHFVVATVNNGWYTAGTVASTGSGLTVNQWHHLVGAYDGSKVLLYINGTLAASSQQGSISGNLVSNSNIVAVGQQLAFNTDHFDGLIDEVKVFDRALSDSEVKALFFSFLSQAIQNIVQEVIKLNVEQGLHNGLVSKLDGAAAAIHDPNENNNGQAVNSLEAFISTVQARRGIEISEADADALIAGAQAILEPLE